MSKTIVLIHNSKVIIDTVQTMFKQIYPEASLINIMDESLLRDIKEKGCIDHLGVRRICRYALCAEDLGGDAALMTCSSLCEAVDVAREMVKIPVFKINEPMAEEAVNRAKKIVVMGTLQSVLAPTVRLIRFKAKESGRNVDIRESLCKAAFEALISGDAKKHDEMLIKEVENAAGQTDLIVFAQGSMSRLVPEAKKRVDVPVLECIESGVGQIKDYFESQ